MILVVVIVYGSIGKELLSSVLCFCLIKHRFSVKCLGFMQAVGVNRGAEASSSSVASGSKKSCHFDIVNFKEDLGPCIIQLLESRIEGITHLTYRKAL